MKYKINHQNCSKCDKKISSSNLARHETKCLGKPVSIQYRCDKCNKDFKNLAALKGHTYRSHSEEGKFIQKKNASLGGFASPSKKGKKLSSETKEKISVKRIEHLSKRKFFSKREVYNGIVLDSTYESIVARELDKHHVLWERPSKGIKYFDGTQNRHYLPDFYLVDYDIYLDPKNDWLIQKDKKKIKLVSLQNSITIIVLSKDKLDWSSIEKEINGREHGYAESAYNTFLPD